MKSEEYRGLSIDLTNCLQQRNQELADARRAIAGLIVNLCLLADGSEREHASHEAINQGREWLANYNKRFQNRAEAPNDRP